VTAVTFSPIPDVPELDLVATPAIAIDDTSVTTTARDVGGHDVAFHMAPIQAVRVTTIDCFQAPSGLAHRLTRVHGATSSQWLDELSAALAVIDPSATFMERAVHVIVPLGDNVLEVVAWTIEVTRPGAPHMSWPSHPA
jgi:hypothetical protein